MPPYFPRSTIPEYYSGIVLRGFIFDQRVSCATRRVLLCRAIIAQLSRDGSSLSSAVSAASVDYANITCDMKIRQEKSTPSFLYRVKPIAFRTLCIVCFETSLARLAPSASTSFTSVSDIFSRFSRIGAMSASRSSASIFLRSP